MKAYLDIETCAGNQITVIGIYREDRGFVQLVGGGITDVSVWEALEGADVLCTFNGDRFDLPILEQQMRLDLRSRIRSMDLLRECRARGITGGLKRLEQRFGIARTTRGMNGWDAMRLWARYEQEGDEEALRRLLEYNREDVMNLVALERIVVGVGLELEELAPPRRQERQGELDLSTDGGPGAPAPPAGECPC
ncbi:MAG: ribonuclease H-like domain-containing protein [Candidatus Methylomirabilales bacterium]